MSKEDQMLGGLRDAVREGDVLADPRWEGLSRGTLEPEEERSLLERARSAGLSDDELAAFRPLGEDAEERLAALALQALAGANEQAAPAVGPREDKPAGSADVVRLPQRPALSRRPRGVFTVVGGALALAAGLFLVFFIRPRPLDPLPAYAVEIEGGVREVRSTARPVEVYRFAPGGRVSFLARPDERVKGDVEARAFLLRDGQARRWEVPITVAEGGVVRITGAFNQLFASVPPGEWELVLAVGRPSALPDLDAVTAGGEPARGVTLLRHRIFVAAAPP